MSRPGNRQRYKSTNQGGKLPQSTAMLLEQAPEQPNHTTLVLSQKMIKIQTERVKLTA